MLEPSAFLSVIFGFAKPPPAGKVGRAVTAMVAAFAASVPGIVIAVANWPNERAIGGCAASTPRGAAGGAPYPAGGAALQSPSSNTGATTFVRPGRGIFVISAAVSDRRMRTLALVKSRSL